MTHAPVLNAISAIVKVIQRATTCSDSSCFSEKNMLTPAILMLHFKLQNESVNLQEYMKLLCRNVCSSLNFDKQLRKVI